MSRLSLYALLLTAALGGAACASDEPTVDPGPDPIEVVEDLTGRLTVNGAVTHSFSAENSGNITATLTAVSGETPPPLSMALGIWNGVSCTLVVTNDKAILGATAAEASVVAQPTVTGTYCLRVSDPGTLTAAVDYTVQLRHF